MKFMNNPAERLYQIATGFREAKILLAAAQLKIFERLRGEGAAAAAVRQTMGGSLRATEILLDALTAMGVLVKTDGVYRNHPDFEALLLEDSPTHTIGGLRHSNRLFRHWAFLEEIMTGRPLPAELQGEDSSEDADSNENFIRAMYAYSRATAGEVIDRIDLRGVRLLADFGGGPGHYLAEFARRSPGLEPYLVDLPMTLDVARKIQGAGPEGRRFTYVAWDFYADPPPADLPRFDLIFLSQVIHSESPEANQRLFRRLLPVTEPGGRLILHERVVDPDRTTPKEAALFAVNMLAMTEGGRTYTEDEIGAWGEHAGYDLEGGERINDRSFLIRFRRP